MKIRKWRVESGEWRVEDLSCFKHFVLLTSYFVLIKRETPRELGVDIETKTNDSSFS